MFRFNVILEDFVIFGLILAIMAMQLARSFQMASEALVCLDFFPHGLFENDVSNHHRHQN
jgi:hypothetical protein